MRFVVLASLASALLVKRETTGVQTLTGGNVTATVTVVVAGNNVNVAAVFSTSTTSTSSVVSTPSSTSEELSTITSDEVIPTTTDEVPTTTTEEQPPAETTPAAEEETPPAVEPENSPVVPENPPVVEPENNPVPPTQPEIPGNAVVAPETGPSSNSVKKRQLIGENIIYLSGGDCLASEESITAAGASTANGAQQVCTGAFAQGVRSIRITFSNGIRACVNVFYAPTGGCSPQTTTTTATSPATVNVNVVVDVTISNVCTGACQPREYYYLYPYFCQAGGNVVVYGLNYVCVPQQYIYVTRQYVLAPNAVTVIQVPRQSTQPITVPPTVTITPTRTITGQASTAAVTSPPRPTLPQVNSSNKLSVAAGLLYAMAGLIL